MNPNPTTRRLPPNVYPLQTFLNVERLMAKLNLTPADCLELLAETLECLDQQITEFEAAGRRATISGLTLPEAEDTPADISITAPMSISQAAETPSKGRSTALDWLTTTARISLCPPD